MKHILIITEDVVKIQTFTGILGKAYSRFFLFWLKLNLIIKIWWLDNFYQVSILTSDSVNLKHANISYYSQELSRLRYSEERLNYWQKTTQLLDTIKSNSPDFFQELGIDITRAFSTRLCTNLVYEYLVYEQICRRLIQSLQPDKVIYLMPLSRINRWLLSWLLEREYRLKLKRFLISSHVQNKIKKYDNPVLLSLDFFRHKKTLEPIFLALQKTKYSPIYVTDSLLAPFLPNAEILSQQYLSQTQTILKDFYHPLKPMIIYNLVLSKLYLKAAQNLFSTIKPKRLIVVSDVRNLETSLVLIARKNNVRSIMVSPNALLDLAEINPYDSTDHIALPGQLIKDKLIKQGVAPAKLTVVGDLQTLNPPRFTKNQVYKILGIEDLNKKLILLISFRPNWLIPLPEKQKFLEWSLKASQKFTDAVLVIKPHPTEKRYRILGELKAMHINNVIVANNQELELVDLLNIASVVLQTWSMTLFEAVNLHRPVISVNPFKKNYDFFLPVIKRGGAVEATSQKELIYWVNAFLNNQQLIKQQIVKAKKAISDFVQPSDGQAVQRVLKLLE